MSNKIKTCLDKQDIVWEMDWGENFKEKFQVKQRYETMYEETGMLASLLINDQLFLNNHHWKKDWPEEAKQAFSINLNMNDVFYWGCADVEAVLFSELKDLYLTFEKDPYNGPIIWASIKRGELPQLPVLRAMRDTIDISQLIQSIKDKSKKDDQSILPFMLDEEYYLNRQPHKMIRKLKFETYKDMRWLKQEELIEAFGQKHLIIGGLPLPDTNEIFFLTGDLWELNVPADFLIREDRRGDVKLDDLQIIDYGLTIALGATYEIASNYILEEFGEKKTKDNS